MRWIHIGLAAVVVLAAVVLYVRYGRSGGGPPPADRDAMVIDRLRSAGANLSKPHPIEFFLYFPSEHAARQAADRLRAGGGEVTVQPGADGKKWLCLLTRSFPPTSAGLVQARKQLTDLASELGGEYDGWGTEVVE